jgi:penicillin-binding protein 1C
LNKRRALINALAALLFLGALLAGVRLVPHPPLGQELSFSQAIFDAQGELLRLTLAADQRYRLWAPLAQISPKLQEAALLQEDQYFYYHPGFNPFSLLRAAAVSYLSGGRRQGGSTITMQLARMRWRLDSRDVLGKILQTLRAIQLELCYSKDEILEAYFNYAPYGRNIEGIAAASLIYFNKSASQLTLPEILSLAVIPRAPAAYLRAFQGQPQNFRSPLLQARNQLLQRWRRNHEVDDKQAALFSLPLNLRQPEDLPFLAPHFVDQLLTERSLRRIKYIRSTLEGRLQR